MSPSTPITTAAIDCGTNTVRLLISSGDRQLVRESRIVRLGEGVDSTGRLADGALERAFTCLDEYAALITQHDVERIRFCATSATRDASNSAVFTAGVRARLGVDPEVVSGDEEAALSYAGAVANLRNKQPEPVLVIDTGGGSTELILGQVGAISLDIGSVRMHERHLHSDPPTAAEIANCTAGIDEALDGCPFDLAEAAAVVGVAGTFLTVAAGVLGIATYDPKVVDQAEFEVERFHAMTEKLLALTATERIDLGFVNPGRADVIGAGALIVSQVLRRTRVLVVTASESDILDGIAASIAS